MRNFSKIHPFKRKDHTPRILKTWFESKKFFRKRNGGIDQKASGQPITGRYACENFTLSKNRSIKRNSEILNTIISRWNSFSEFFISSKSGDHQNPEYRHPSDSGISGIPIGQNKINRLYKNRSSKYPGFCPGFIRFNCHRILRILILTEFGSGQAPTNEFIFT